MTSTDAVFTKYLKRYLGITYHANNSITHFITSITHTEPLSNILKNLYPQSYNSLSFPSCLSGLKLTQETIQTLQYDPIPLVPSYFWHSRYPGHLPTYANSRRLLCQDIYDLYHQNFCTNTTFHVRPDNDCTCIDCGNLVSHYHSYFCHQ